jgi:hypothetical protein
VDQFAKLSRRATEKVSTAGYFADNQFVTVQVETTNAGTGTLTNKNYPVVEIAGEEFRAREACIDMSQEELDANDDTMFQFTENARFQRPGIASRLPQGSWRRYRDYQRKPMVTGMKSIFSFSHCI